MSLGVESGRIPSLSCFGELRLATKTVFGMEKMAIRRLRSMQLYPPVASSYRAHSQTATCTFQPHNLVVKHGRNTDEYL